MADAVQRAYDDLERALVSASELIREDITDLFARYNKRAIKTLLAYSGNPLTVNVRARVLDDLLEVLETVGFEALISQQIRQYPNITKVGLSYFREIVSPDAGGLREIDVDALAALVELRERSLRQLVGARAVEPYVQSVVNSLAGQADESLYLSNLQTISNGMNVGVIAVHATESFDLYSRTLNVIKAKELGLKLYAYRGPLDAITSPQCVTMLQINKYGAAGVLPEDEITRDLHPNMAKNSLGPLQGGGHPNCRHQWLPITRERAELLGYEGPE